MKIKLSIRLRKVLLAAVSLVALLVTNVQAEALTWNGGEGAGPTALANPSGVNDITLNITGTNNYFNSTSFDDNFIVQRWLIENGGSHNSHTFTGTISDYYTDSNPEPTGDAARDYEGDIVFVAWGSMTTSGASGSGSNNYRWIFQGSMEDFSGDILAVKNGLNLIFSGNARDSVSGTGAIDTWYTTGSGLKTAKDLTYNIASTADIAPSTINNSSINAIRVEFLGSTSYELNSVVTTSDLRVGSVLNVNNSITTSTLSIQSSGAAVFKNGSILNLQQATGHSNAGSLTFEAGSTLGLVNGTTLAGNIIFGAGSTINVANNTSLTGNVTIDRGATVNLDLSLGTTALSITNLTLSGEGTLDFTFGESADFYTKGATYTILDIKNGDGFSLADFTATLTGIDSSYYDLTYVNGKLQLFYSGGASTLVWNDEGTGDWDASSLNWSPAGGGDATSFINGDLVSFTGAGGTVTIKGSQTPGGIAVDSSGDYIFAQGANGEITGAATLVKDGTGSLTLDGTNSYTGGTILNEGTLRISDMTALGTGNLTINGGTLGLYGEDALTVNMSKVNFASGIAASFDLENGKVVTLSSISSMGNHDLVVTGEGTLKHDSWAHVNSVDVGAGATVEFTQTSAGSTAFKTIKGEGTIITNNTSEWQFRVNLDSTDVFGGNLKVGTNGRVLFDMDHSSATSRIGLDLGSGSVLTFYCDTAGSTLYLDSLTGTGELNYKNTANLRHINLELTESQTFSGTILQDTDTGATYDRVGSFYLSSQGDDAHHTFTLDGVGSSGIHHAEKVESRGHLIVSNASVKLEGDAQWNSVIQLNDADAQLIFNNSDDVTRSADAGSISGAGSVEISAGKTVTLEGANSYEGTTQVLAGATLNLGHNDAAGESVIQMAGSTLGFADGLTVTNDMILSGTTNEFTASSSEALVTLTGDISASSTRSTAAVEITQGQFTFENSNISDIAVSVADGQSLHLENVTINANTTFSKTGTGVITTNRLTSTGVGVTAGTERTITTIEGESRDVVVHTLTGVNTGDGLVDESFTLTVTVADLAAYQTLLGSDGVIADGEIIGFELDGVSDLPIWYNNVFIEFSNGSTTFGSHQVMGYDPTSRVEGSNLIVYIPEPSTATLSLLALTGLLARRRRKSA